MSRREIATTQGIIRSQLVCHAKVLEAMSDRVGLIADIAHALLDTLHDGGKIILCGNGGSAADAQHIAAELVGRFHRERGPLPAMALTTDTSILTAVANDFGFECVFEQQLAALGHINDAVIGISTSGKSLNVNLAMIYAEGCGMTTVALTGKGGGSLAHLVDHALIVPSIDTARIQEMHILVGHILCELIDANYKT